MELTNILNSNAVRVVREIEPPRVFLPDLSRTIAERYRFVKHPTTVEDFSGEFLEFRFGNFFSDTVVTRLQIYNSGLVAEAPIHTNELDRFLDDVMVALGDFGLSISSANVQRLYGSTLELRMKPGFGAWFQQINPVISAVRNAVEQSGVAVSVYETGGFTIVGEGPEALKPPRFVLERRIEQPLNANLFFSQGPLSTDQHVRLLTEIETMF